MASGAGKVRPVRQFSAALAASVVVLLAACSGGAPPVRGSAVPTVSPPIPPAAAPPATSDEAHAQDAVDPQPTTKAPVGHAASRDATTHQDTVQATAPRRTSHYVAASRLNVFSGPATSRRFLGSLVRGSKVMVLTTSHGWSKVLLGHGTGWVWAAYLSAHEPPKIAPAAPAAPATSVGAAPSPSAPTTAPKTAPAKKSTAPKSAPSTPKKAVKRAAPKTPLLVDSIAHRYGVARVVYATTSACGALTKSPTQGGILGCFEMADPGQIKVAAWMRQYTTASPASAGRNRADVTARHETAHALIDRRCGTAIPPIAGKRIENIADAYSELYVGAPTAYYGYTAADAKKARKIHAGDCS